MQSQALPQWRKAVGARRPAIPQWLGNRAGAALILAVLFAVLGVACLVMEIGRPFGRYVTYGYIGRERVDVINETPDWWLAEGPVRHGDDLLAINGLPYSTNAWREYERAFDEQRPVTLTIDRHRAGRLLQAEVDAVPITLAHVVDVKLPEVTMAVVFWVLAMLVLRARPSSPTTQVFVILGAAIAIQRLTAVTSMGTDDRVIANLPKIGHMLAAGLIGPLFCHLALLFPTSLSRRPRLLLRVVYGWGLAAGLTLTATRFAWWKLVPISLGDAIDRAGYYSVLYLAVGGIGVMLARLGWSLWRERQTRRQRLSAGFVLLGLLGAVPYLVIVLNPILPGVSPTPAAFWYGLDLRYTLLATPIAFAYVIIRYHALRTPSRLFIIVLIISLSALLAAVGAWLWRLGQPPENLSQRPPFVTMYALILLASLFWSSQTNWRGVFGRLMYWAPGSYASARSFGARVMDKTDLRELPQTIAEALTVELQLERAVIWMRLQDADRLSLAASAGGPDSELLAQFSPAIGEVPRHGRAIRTRAGEVGESWLRPLAAGQLIEVVVPLFSAGTVIGVLGLGRRWDEEIFDERDLVVAELVGQQAALFLLAAIQIEALRQVPERIAQAQERERLRLAQELHDTVQQFLGRLPFFLTVSRNMMRTDPDGAAALLDRCLTDIEEAATMLRGIQLNLAPVQLESSLARPLDGLVGQVRQRSGLNVRLVTTPDLDEGTTAETRHALYRVIQQALDNVVTHAEATEISVQVTRDNGRVVFQVHDNGRGFTLEERREAQADGSFGLRSMQARVEMCGGEFALTSTEGAGTTVAGWVPAVTAKGDPSSAA